MCTQCVKMCKDSVKLCYARNVQEICAKYVKGIIYEKKRGRMVSLFRFFIILFQGRLWYHMNISNFIQVELGSLVNMLNILFLPRSKYGRSVKLTYIVQFEKVFVNSFNLPRSKRGSVVNMKPTAPSPLTAAIRILLQFNSDSTNLNRVSHNSYPIHCYNLSSRTTFFAT